MSLLISLFSTESYSRFPMWILFILLVLGLFFLTRGSNFIIIGASKMARLLHISEYIIGITIVALSTSLPEFFISISAATKGIGVISLANVIGSNIFNISLIFMILCLFSKKLFNISWKSIILLTLLNSILLIMDLLSLTKIPRWVGITFLSALTFYFIVAIHKVKTQNVQKNNPLDNKYQLKPELLKNLLLSILQLSLGSGLLYMGSEIFLDSTRQLGHLMGIPDAIIGIFFIALGTSLPELMVTITALLHIKKLAQNNFHNSNFQDMAEGNIIGSNILNILGVLGLTITISPLSGITSLQTDVIVMTVATLLLLLLIFQKLIFQKLLGMLLCLLLISYILFLFIL